MAASPPDATLRGLVASLMKEDFARTHWLWVEGHLRILVELRQVFGNDLDKIMILAVIGQQMLGEPQFQTSRFEQLGNVIPPLSQERLTNIGSIAAATGIPRESVRRKVDELVKAGWVVRGANGHLVVDAQASSDLSPPTLTAIDMLDGLFTQFAGLLAARGWIELHKLPSANAAASFDS
ncbi:hypothetical protein EUV02_04585 [Polymorphobacter arshaanensis]|uniref:HTH crp-type domain-containing protein n=2 Tax=Glacieibacterium arshaanense TaxID=2511025 RepID=A0A4Y9ESY5_9SPHN|nr:hypothetical protein EUV02_04585 [Polymorphobacter arshaanensis]